MKKILITALAVAAVAPYSLAQSSIDALSLSRTELRGTARFMGMGGAFTALGGDLSSIPAWVVHAGEAREISLYVADMTAAERAIVRAGCLINYNRTRREKE